MGLGDRGLDFHVGAIGLEWLLHESAHFEARIMIEKDSRAIGINQSVGCVGLGFDDRAFRGVHGFLGQFLEWAKL